MLKKIGIVVVVLIVAVLGFIFMRPESFHLERSATIHAPRAMVWELINTMEKRRAWYPWDRLDPNQKVTYSGPASGKGAHYAWSGNDKVGSGEQTIVESVPMEKVVDDLHFTAPFEDRNTATFTLADDGENTKVTWALDGGKGFSGRMMNAFMNMDEMVGPDFENGLKYLDEAATKAKAELAAAAAAVPEAAPAEGEAVPVEGEAKPVD